MSSKFSSENKNNFSLHLPFPDKKTLLLSRMVHSAVLYLLSKQVNSHTFSRIMRIMGNSGL